MSTERWFALEAQLIAEGHTVFRGNDNYFVVNGKVVRIGPDMKYMLAKAKEAQ